ncbi:hypothetical protein SAMN05216382_0797 [Sphingomonas palmae]|uniref:Uncharacterized protein n=1 Tax=Sphingomonas palmae TaxID=1855283 RepID=A0A1H7IKH2_9SPHN|nr:hypothetical protein [Sphingomonas palmae]SEK62969.1 hypothetical protein SAMN05216382_0797 [Sphingomonas palmae]
MLAGLLFATREAVDRPGTLTATLPFAAATLIEYQARLLIAAGASQIVVIVSRLTPELIGALARIGKRGVAVDAVRSATDALGKLHPLARVLLIADGLVTNEPVVNALAGEKDDTLLVVPDAAAGTEFERIGGGVAWAGLARMDARRLSEAAGMPADYDLQSTLLHVLAQARAERVELPAHAIAQGHGIEHRASALDQRGRAVLSATMAARPGWFDRVVLRPLTRLAVPEVARRGVATMAVAGVGGVLALVGLAGVYAGWRASGLAAVLAGVILAELAGSLALFRDEAEVQRGIHVASLVAPALAILLLGQGLGAVALLLAVQTVALGGLSERAARPSLRRRWWGGAPAYLAVVTAGTLLGLPLWGLAAAALYATATLAGTIEALRPEA